MMKFDKIITPLCLYVRGIWRQQRLLRFETLRALMHSWSFVPVVEDGRRWDANIYIHTIDDKYESTGSCKPKITSAVIEKERHF
jgi:hypothetical protein